MSQWLQLDGPERAPENETRRLNRLPLYIGIGLIVGFLAVLIYGLSERGLHFSDKGAREAGSLTPATSFADQLKRGVKDGIIGERDVRTVQPSPAAVAAKPPIPVESPRQPARIAEAGVRSESDVEWRARLRREGEEQLLREQQRRRMASLQAQSTALDAPLKIDVAGISSTREEASSPGKQSQEASPSSSLRYPFNANGGQGGADPDQSQQGSKEAFLNADIKELGYLPNRVVAPQSALELKRGSVIPATLITGINSDLPGRISAQVSQSVFDSATGRLLLIPQGSKLFGRYDSKVAFGQNRVLVVWTDLVFPNGQTLQIGGMAGTDAQGYGGFRDEVNNHYLRTFGSALLVALIGTGIDMAVPQSSTLSTQSTASDAARRNFAESFGRVAEQSVSKNLNVQPTIEIRPGYVFNVLVDQDMVFPSVYHG